LDPFVKTNILVAMNLIDACIDQGVQRVVALSTDKASSPANLYGATKLTSDKLFIAGNSYVALNEDTRFAVVRYGNVLGSRGSVVPFFISLSNSDAIPITDARMTRFIITLQQSVELVWQAFKEMVGGEIYVKKIPSMKLTDMAFACAPTAKHKVVGIRPGEKLHEQMIGQEDAPHTYEYAEHFKILPAIHNWHLDPIRINGGKLVPPNFTYCSDTNTDWMSIETLRSWISQNSKTILNN
jgi:FlaA1/EpsC-like NDP-sugar epimerase